MSSVVIAGNTSGSVTLQAPDVAGTTTLTLPATSGTVLAPSGGVLPVASGGTGTSSPSLVGGTNITISGTWPNQTVTAAGGGVTSLNGQTGAITNTDLYAIGSYTWGHPANTTSYSPNSTVAGSSLYATSYNNSYNNSSGTWTDSTQRTLVNTGTWRCMSYAQGTSTTSQSGLWVRIS